MANTVQSVISDIIEREGPASNDPADHGGDTAFGISKEFNPDAWKDGPPSEAKARDIYYKKYVVGPGFDKIVDKGLQAQLVDMGVTSGPAVAINKLQGILHVNQDGVLGAKTLAALTTITPEEVNNLLVAERVRLIGRIVQRDPSQVKFLGGWLERALEFLS